MGPSLTQVDSQTHTPIHQMARTETDEEGINADSADVCRALLRAHQTYIATYVCTC